MNERQVKDRVLQLFKEKRISVRAMAEKIGMAQKNLNNQVSGDVALSLRTLLLIIDTFPDVSAEWLLRGTGDMFLWQSAVDSAERKDEGKELAESAGGASVAELRREIAELRKDKENLMLLIMQITKR